MFGGVRISLRVLLLSWPSRLRPTCL